MSAPVDAPWYGPFTTSGRAAVVHVDLAPDASREAEALERLNPEERERWERYPYSGPRRQFVLCRAALRAVLCEQLGCRSDVLAFPTSEHGKPWATVEGAPAPISFNVSHSGRHGLIAFAPEGRLGVDVEELVPRRNLELLMDGVLAGDERREVAATAEPERLRRFFRLWTMKEAVLKAHGKGLLLDATMFEVPAAVRRGEPRGKLRLPQLPEATWEVEDIGDEQFAAALAREVDGEPGPDEAEPR